MKDFKTYLPIAAQAAILIVGFLLINSGLANETNLKTNIANTEISVDKESNIKIEGWMTDLSYWPEVNNKINETNTISAKYAVILSDEVSFEEAIELEEWMTDAGNNNWNAEYIATSIDSEEEMTIENWMVDLAEWNN
jgi:hypothetical protein